MKQNEFDFGGTAVVVLSGGQDSTTCLGWACRRYPNVHAVTFYYGQKHQVEVAAAENVIRRFRKRCDTAIESHSFGIGVLKALGDSALTTGGDVSKAHHTLKDLPASFVPGRNALFLTVAYSLAMKVGAEAIVTGVCQTDYSGYPDCREEFVWKLNEALDMGYTSKINILTPLMHLNKAQTFAMATKENCLDIVLQESVTCYEGNLEMNEWGRGCGKCPACTLRKKGYEEYIATMNGVA